MSDTDCRHNCNICNKNYASSNSLWNHNKKFHSKNIISNSNNVLLNSNNILLNSNNIKLYNCRKCNKEFNNVKTRWAHEKKCKELKVIENNKIELLENKIKELETKFQTTNNKIINKNNTNNTNNGIINNTTNIKVSFGEEDIDNISSKDKKAILNSGFSSLVKLIELVHLNKKYPQYQNIKIDNLKDKFAKTYDENDKIFTTVSKQETIDNLICYRTLDLKSIYKNHNTEDNKLHQCVLKLINKIESYTPDTDDKNILDFYKNLTSELILMIYNKTKLYDQDSLVV